MVKKYGLEVGGKQKQIETLNSEIRQIGASIDALQGSLEDLKSKDKAAVIGNIALLRTQAERLSREKALFEDENANVQDEVAGRALIVNALSAQPSNYVTTLELIVEEGLDRAFLDRTMTQLIQDKWDQADDNQREQYLTEWRSAKVPERFFKSQEDGFVSETRRRMTEIEDVIKGAILSGKKYKGESFNNWDSLKALLQKDPRFRDVRFERFGERLVGYYDDVEKQSDKVKVQEKGVKDLTKEVIEKALEISRKADQSYADKVAAVRAYAFGNEVVNILRSKMPEVDDSVIHDTQQRLYQEMKARLDIERNNEVRRKQYEAARQKLEWNEFKRKMGNVWNLAKKLGPLGLLAGGGAGYGIYSLIAAGNLWWVLGGAVGLGSVGAWAKGMYEHFSGEGLQRQADKRMREIKKEDYDAILNSLGTEKGEIQQQRDERMRLQIAEVLRVSLVENSTLKPEELRVKFEEMQRRINTMKATTYDDLPPAPDLK